MNLAEKTLQKARIVHAVFLLTSILYMIIPMVVFKTQTKEVHPAVILAISFIAVSDVGMDIFYRSKFFPSLAEVLLKNLQDAAAARKWFIGVVRSYVFCEMTILFGLALRILGANWNICGLFFVAGILLLLAWTPKLDLPSSANG